MWIVLLTFLIGTADVKEATVACPTWACVEELRSHEGASRALVRLRVWRKYDFARVEFGAAIWPPVVDDRPI